MYRIRSIFTLAGAFACGLLILAGPIGAQESKPDRTSETESALVGIWQDKAEQMPDLEIRINRDRLRIRVIDPESNDQSYDRLDLLEMPGDQDSAGAFATVATDDIDTHLILALQDAGLQVQTIEIFKGSPGRANRLVTSTYRRSEDRNPFAGTLPDNSKRRRSGSATKQPEMKQKQKLGRISGTISTRSTLRGTIRITPTDQDKELPKNVRPASGLLRLGGTNPEFDFTNLPSGKYDLHFEGTINGVSRAVDWKGVDTDPAGTSPSLSLSLKRAGAN